VPAFAKTREAELPGSVSGMLPPVGESDPNVTLCRDPLNCHVTVLPGVTFTTRGENVSPGVLTTMLLELGADTVTVAVAARVVPPDVIDAVIVAWPGAAPVTRPVDETVAMELLLDDHVAAGRPCIAVPFWSRPLAVSWTVAPTFKAGVFGVTATDVNTTGPEPSTMTVPDIPEWRVQS
jgi:hypothetical protein